VASVQSVERAVAVLRCLAGGSAGVTEIAERCDLPKSTVSRLLATLHELEVVEQLAPGGDYRIGTLITQLAAGSTPTVDLVTLSRPHLVELADRIGEATGLSVLDRDRVHYLTQIDGSHAVQVRDWTGERVPAHLVPSGLVLLAAAAPAARQRVLEAPLVATTERSMTDPEQLATRLDRIVGSGLAWVVDEFADGITSVAAVVRGRTGVAVAAVHAHGPSYRFPGRRRRAEIEALVLAAAARISERVASGG
jgi:DNA-binding IclR family transcriptional regulator